MKNPAVDAYIAKSAAFARPILERLRAAFHKGCPTIEETIKWGVPHFEKDGIVGSMAAFKEHVAWGFWNKKLVARGLGKDAEKLFPKEAERGMGGRKARSPADLPPGRLLVRAVQVAVALNEAGVRPSRAAARKPPPKTPPDLAAALRRNRKAAATYERFTDGRRREYVDWLTGAKQAQTRARRLAQAVEWLAEGKKRYWKYESC